MNVYVGKFSGDTTEEQTAKISAINIAKNIIISSLGIPASERTKTITFIETKEKYLLDNDFMEPISLYYDDTFGSIYENINTKVDFVYLYPEEIIKSVKENSIIRWGIDYSNVPTTSGLFSAIIKTKAVRNSLIIDDCDSTTNWSTGDDATSLTADTLKYKTGSASLKFKIDKTLSGNQRATLKLQISPSLDLSSYVNLGNFFLNLYMVNTTGFSSITLKWGQNISNYYWVSQTVNADGTLYNNSWNEFIFDWNNANVIGSPTSNNVSYFEINIDYNESQFASPQWWNLDTLQIISPDRFILRYYSQNVITDSSGNLKKDFSNTTDVAVYALADYTLGDLTARIAASIYKPLINKELGGDSSFLNSLSSELIEPFRLRYPKKTPLYYRGKIVGPRLRNV
jgi:hypothetical protein